MIGKIEINNYLVVGIFCGCDKGYKSIFFFKNDVYLYNVGDLIILIFGYLYNYFSRLIIVFLLKNFLIDGEFLIDFK